MPKPNALRRIITFLGSSRFFWLILAFFVLEAAWIALTGRYPMAFDEDYHLGIIRLYREHISPFWSAQPAGADAFGAVFRDPSYLYHWLMSFPYRFVSLFTSNEATIVLWLRALNIALFAGGLVLYRRLLLKTGAARAIVNGVLLLFVLIPVVPLLAAQINYDNLFMPLLGLLLLLVVRFDARHFGKKRVDFLLAGGIVALCLLGSLVKYAFLPIFVAVAMYLAVRLWQSRKTVVWRVGPLSGPLVGILLLVLVSGGLFAERYGVNFVRYHTPVADCAQVLSVEACSHYGPWVRDHNLELRKSATAPSSPITFAADWLYGMWLRLFFAVDGPGTSFQTRGPLTLPAISTIVFAVSGALASVVYAPHLFRKYQAAVLALLLSVAGVYIAILWLDGYQTFLRTGIPVAINGRYLLPVLPFLMLFAALAFNELLKGRETLKVALAGVAVLCMLWGGGALTYILRSNDRWYWPGTPLTRVNHTIQNNIGPFVPGYRDPIAYMHRHKW